MDIFGNIVTGASVVIMVFGFLLIEILIAIMGEKVNDSLFKDSTGKPKYSTNGFPWMGLPTGNIVVLTILVILYTIGAIVS
jgi:hypothetical protein